MNSFTWDLKIHFYFIVFKFCFCLNLKFKGILNHRNKEPNKENPLNSSIIL